MGERRPNVFVEVGLGYSRICGFGKNFPFQPGDFYIGIDLPHATGAQHEGLVEADLPDRIVLSTEEAERLSEDPVLGFGKGIKRNNEILRSFAAAKGIHFVPVYADGRELTLKTGVATEVLLSNVLGDAGIGDTDRHSLLQEARRVAGAAGRVVIKEVYTPAVAEEYFDQHPPAQPMLRIDANFPGSPEHWERYDMHRGTLFIL